MATEMHREGTAPDLDRLGTPSIAPWSEREHVRTHDGDPRDPFDRDRDRILHSESFRRLQHKTQVFIVTESDLFRTRITHSLEVAQIGRSAAKAMGLSESLVEAICLAHDVGHTPFGHIGEETLNNLLQGQGGWNSNTHSLFVLDRLEAQYPSHLGLDLTWATREGIARHASFYDVPEAFGDYTSPSLEAQVANVADPIAYATHDVHDALQYRLIAIEDLAGLGTDLWAQSWRKTTGEFDVAHPQGTWEGVDVEPIMIRRVHRHMLDFLIRDLWRETAMRAEGVATLEQARWAEAPIVALSHETYEQIQTITGFMMDRVYKSPLVARQNAKAKMMLQALFNALMEDPRLLPVPWQERYEGSAEQGREVAYFLASLTDRSAIDLYGELFLPADRAMGHHVLS